MPENMLFISACGGKFTDHAAEWKSALWYFAPIAGKGVARPGLRARERVGRLLVQHRRIDSKS